MSQDRRSRIAAHSLVAALYFLLALVLTWPLVRHLSTHVPGSYTWAFDEYTFLWNSWWFRYAAFDLEQNPLFSTHTFYPLGISLVLYTYNLFNALISLPLQPFFSLPAISNLTFLFATALSGYGTFILVKYLLRPEPDSRFTTAAAFLAGLIYTFGSYRMVYAAIGHYDMWSTAWIPFYALYLIRTIREPHWQNAVLAAVFLAMAMLCEMIFGVFLAILSLILLVFLLVRRERASVAGGPRALLKRLLVLGLVATLLYSPVLVPVLREMLGGYELAGWGDAEKLSVDLLGLITPTALHPLGGDWVETLQQTREGSSRFSDVNTVFLGWTSLALAVVGAVYYRRRLAAWITGLFVFALFSLGPVLQINGRSTFDLDGLLVNVPLPFILLHYLPIIKANRVPNRFSVVLMLTLAVLAGFGAYWLLKKVSGARVRVSRFLLVPGVAVLAALVLFEHWSAPLPLTDARIPPVFEQVTEGDYTLLQLPLGWRNSFGMMGAESTQTQYYQSYHRKRLLSGNISRNPPFEFDYFRGVPTLDSLMTIETYGQVDAERRASDRSTAAEFVSFYDIRYVAVAPGIPGRPPYVDTRDEAVAYIEEVLPVEKVYDQDGWLLYRVDQTALPSSFLVDFGSTEPRTKMVLGEGWAGDEQIQGATANWAAAGQARVFLPAAAGSDYRLTVAALPFDYPGAGEQGMKLRVNGNELIRVALMPGWAEYTWDVPADLLRPGLNDLWFEFDHAAAPADVLPGNGAIGATGVQAPVAIEVHSSGPEDFAYITAGTGEEAEDGSVHSPGYNVAVIDPRTGRILDRQGFDTTPGGSEAEADALAGYLTALPEGRIVAVAMQGEGAANLTEKAVAALHGLGGQADPRGTTGWSHALIGVKGAEPGTAQEVAGPGDGWLRVAPDERTLAAAVDTLLWEQKE